MKPGVVLTHFIVLARLILMIYMYKGIVDWMPVPAGVRVFPDLYSRGR